MNKLCFSLHSQAAKFCHRAAELLPPQTCFLTTNYRPALHSSPSCPAPIPHFPAVVSTLCPAKHPSTILAQSHESIPDAAAAQRRTRSTGPSPFSSLASANGPASTRPSLACIFLLACFASDLHVSPLAKRVRDPACGSPVGRARRSVRREESRPRRADSLRFCGTRAQRGLGCIGGNVEHLKTAVWRRRSGQASFW
jgi:hypothetical protein